MPICILEHIYQQCLQLGLNPDDAHDCVAEVCLRYRKRTGAFPHDEATPDLRLLRLLTRNVVREHQRAQQRRQRLEQDYLALQRQQQASAPTPMAQAIARVDCERFRAQLPDYLRRTLELMEAGDTPKAIAAQLGVAVGTVYSYQRELRERFVAFFGYDPRKSGVRVVNYSGCSEVSSSDNRFRTMRRQKMLGVVALSLAIANLIAGLGQTDRLQIRFKGEATLSVSGDVPVCGFIATCPLYERYCSSFWNLCSGGMRTVSALGSYLVLGGEFGGSQGYSSNAQLLVNLFFDFRYSSSLLQLSGFSYEPKTTLGFAYFVDGVKAGAAAIAVAGCQGNYPPCCESGSASANTAAMVSTSVVQALISSSYSASCGCADAEQCLDCTSDGGSQWRADPENSSGHQGFKTSSVSFRHNRSASYTEELKGSIAISGSASECAGAISAGASFAYAGLLLQSLPHPLGVPAIGENEYAWSSDRPARLEIPARAYAYAWGWEPDLGWIADKTAFRVEPEIPSDDTKPGVRTVARGRELVAQSLDGQTDGYADGLLYRSKYLPPRNSDFGKKKVHFEVEGSKVDYAEVEVFYPADASNHPRGGRGCSGRFLIDLNTFQLIACECNTHIEPENWFYYYSQVYNASDAWYATGEITPYIPALTCHGTRPGTGDRVSQIYILPLTSPCRVLMPDLEDEGLSRHLPIPVFRCENGTIRFTQRFLYVAGIHKFIGVVEHEKVHKKMYEEGSLYPPDNSCPDLDRDGLCDRWEDENGLNSLTPRTVPPFPDAELVAYIIGYGKVLDAKEKWKEDWATCGLQFGTSPSPFPWVYADINGRNPSSRPPEGHIQKMPPACQ